jgi:hypothetical protein
MKRREKMKRQIWCMDGCVSKSATEIAWSVKYLMCKCDGTSFAEFVLFILSISSFLFMRIFVFWDRLCRGTVYGACRHYTRVSACCLTTCSERLYTRHTALYVQHKKQTQIYTWIPISLAHAITTDFASYFSFFCVCYQALIYACAGGALAQGPQIWRASSAFLFYTLLP